MATRSMMFIEKNKDEVKGIYCHYDGYLSHNGKILLNHYNSEEKAKELIGLGDLMSLCETIEETRSKSSFYLHKEPICFDVRFNFEIKKLYKKSGIEYIYLFKNNEWHHVNATNDFIKLSDINFELVI